MTTFDRRTVLRSGLVAAAGVATGVASGGPARGGEPGHGPGFRPGGRPMLTHGVQSGDPTAHTAVVWTRADRVGRMLVEVSRRPDLRGARRVRGPVLTPHTDLTGKVRLRGLPAGERLYYRVRVESLDHPGRDSEPLRGSLRTAPDHGGHHRRRDVRFVWSGDIAGQGWGINPDLGGMTLFRSAARLRPRWRSSPRSGSSSPVRRTPAGSGRTSWTARSDRRRCS